MLRHADGDADGKDDRQVAEDDVAGAAHDGEQRVQERAVAEGAFQAVGLNGRRVREGRADDNIVFIVSYSMKPFLYGEEISA